MSYTLDELTLPRPYAFQRDQIETGASIQMLDGSTKKDIINRKERYILELRKLTQTEVSNIIEKYNLQTTLDFSVDETNLNIGSTKVHMDIANRQYNTKGDEYREDLTLILTEVK